MCIVQSGSSQKAALMRNTGRNIIVIGTSSGGLDALDKEMFNSILRRRLDSGSLLFKGPLPVCPENLNPTFRKYGLIRALTLNTLVITPGTGAAQTLPMPIFLNWLM